jgi:hypothetical protein
MNPIEAVEKLSMLPYFPQGQGAKTAVMEELERITNSPQKLEWLITAYVSHVDGWTGPAQLRALYSTRWKPLDGIEGGDCRIPGYTPNDSESQTLAEHAQRKLGDGEARTALARLK